MQFNRISILGVGLLGGSIGLAVRRVSKSCWIIGYGHRTTTLDRARELGAIDEGTTDLVAAVTDADLIILCTPVGLFRETLSKMSPALRRGAIVTDVGSTKRSVVQAAAELLPAHVHFVGSHPMAGSEKRGIEFARADLFDSALCITTPTNSTNKGSLTAVESFWTSIGMRLKRLAPDAHDRLLAAISHLPHAVAAALVSVQSADGLELAGKGFFDTTRIAGGDAALWRDIFVDNRDNLKAAITSLRAELGRLERDLDSNDAEAVKKWLERAVKVRQAQNHSAT